MARRRMTLDDGLFEIDPETGQIFWDGQELVRTVMIQLSDTVEIWLLIFTGIIALATVGSFILRIIEIRGRPATPQTSFQGASGGYSGTRIRPDTSKDAGD